MTGVLEGPHGLDATAAPGRPVDLMSRLQQAVAAGPDRIAVRDRDDSLSFAQLDAVTAHLADTLTGSGVLPGDRVAVSLPGARTSWSRCWPSGGRVPRTCRSIPRTPASGGTRWCATPGPGYW